MYVVVSESPDPLTILKTICENIVGGPAPNFRNIEDAHNQLQLQKINSRRNEPILAVLDDIWRFSDLKDLLFIGEQYMTLVTTGDANIMQCIPLWFNKGHYPLPSLQEEHALSLFCLCAFDMSSIPDTHNEQLVKQVQADCKGLPLALQVIGSSLNRQPDHVWKATRDALARGEVSDDNQIAFLLKRLETSIDIWVYVRRMKRNDALPLVRKFEARHPLDMRRDPGTIVLTTQCRRLYMSQKQSELPPEWQTDEDLSSTAQIISIHTGAMNDTQWPQMDFPEAEALVLYLSASEYCIPPFLLTMKKLKILQIHNDSAKQAKLSGLPDFQALSELKSLHHEGLIVPSLHEQCDVSENLEKLYLSLCEGLGRDTMFNFPRLIEFNVDHCSDLEELPAGICSSNSLKILSITHCKSLAKLPDKLGSLKRIRLYQSGCLEELPPSICRLGELELLNISWVEDEQEQSP
ncbi:hypothetical protein SUGI_0902380 [Cryptomeria japonica]|uniref:probable disease resistance protein At4g33300 n=1 Tax=Cryptomeria japonica TaxID=3369 RepID=UPI002414CA06|nr:probable disease resistance protein At4g33300 [Cryptomeria japonica]GLJ43426.1 hypothetical protein SUGI_0902380 [Cryptomeria japonica]